MLRQWSVRPRVRGFFVADELVAGICAAGGDAVGSVARGDDAAVRGGHQAADAVRPAAGARSVATARLSRRDRVVQRRRTHGALRVVARSAVVDGVVRVERADDARVSGRRRAAAADRRRGSRRRRRRIIGCGGGCVRQSRSGAAMHQRDEKPTFTYARSTQKTGRFGRRSSQRISRRKARREGRRFGVRRRVAGPVSYTHLTLPTILRV